MYMSRIYSITELRKEIRQAFDAAELFEKVTIKRHDKYFTLTVCEADDKFIDNVAKIIDEESGNRLYTDKISSNIRPDIQKIRLAEPKDNWQEAGPKPPVVPVYDSNFKPACCTEFVPSGKLCKHWVWDMDKGTNINSLTGEVRE